MSYDLAALSETMSNAKPGESLVFRHYLYFPNEVDAQKAANELRKGGFHAEERLGADGKNRLVLARHEIVPSEAAVQALRQVMDALVQDFNGEYDGWEAETK